MGLDALGVVQGITERTSSSYIGIHLSRFHALERRDRRLLERRLDVEIPTTRAPHDGHCIRLTHFTIQSAKRARIHTSHPLTSLVSNSPPPSGSCCHASISSHLPLSQAVLVYASRRIRLIPGFPFLLTLSNIHPVHLRYHTVSSLSSVNQPLLSEY